MFRIMSLISSLLALLSCGNKVAWTDLDAAAFETLLQSDAPTLVDIRTSEEYSAGHLPGACNVDWYDADFLQKMEVSFPKETPLAIYCRSGKRSAAAAAKLSKAGYSVTNLLGGFLAWTGAGKAVSTDPEPVRASASRYETESFRTDGGIPVVITLIKHGSLEIRFGERSIQVDPVAGYGKTTDYAAEFPKADLILVTHEHGDHLDPTALAVLTGPQTRLLVNGSSADKLSGAEGIPIPEVVKNGDARIIAFGARPESSVLPGDVIVEAVPAYNTTPGREKFHPKGNGNGYVLTLDGLRIYIAGDTEDIPEMAGLKDIDIAFLPVNQPYTMTPDQCVRAAECFRPKILIPYHFGETDLGGLPSKLSGMTVLLRQMQ